MSDNIEVTDINSSTVGEIIKALQKFDPKSMVVIDPDYEPIIQVKGEWSKSGFFVIITRRKSPKFEESVPF